MDEFAAILRSYHRGLSTREEALEALRKVDPVFLAYRPAETWLD